MPALPSPGKVLRLSYLIGDNASIEAGSRFYLSYSGGTPNSTDLTAIANEAATTFTATLGQSVNSNESLHNVTVVDLSSALGAEGVWTGTEAGNVAGASLPASTCGVMNHTIARRYRGGRPRTYIRIGSTAQLTGTNQWEPSFISATGNNWHNWVNNILGTSGISVSLTDIVNVSWYEGFTVFTTPSGRSRNIPKLRTTPLVDNISLSTLATKLGSQRRRLNL